MFIVLFLMSVANDSYVVARRMTFTRAIVFSLFFSCVGLWRVGCMVVGGPVLIPVLIGLCSYM